MMIIGRKKFDGKCLWKKENETLIMFSGYFCKTSFREFIEGCVRNLF